MVRQMRYSVNWQYSNGTTKFKDYSRKDEALKAAKRLDKVFSIRRYNSGELTIKRIAVYDNKIGIFIMEIYNY